MSKSTRTSITSKTQATESISLSRISKSYSTNDKHESVHALKDIELSIKPGEHLALMGPSGCGKSTLLNLIGGIDRPTSGNIHIQGRDIIALNDQELTKVRREHIGFIFQFFNLLNTLTVAENILLPLQLINNCKGSEALKRLDKALEQVSMNERRTFYPSQLSGGQMQRVAIARALIHNPSIIIADEPTGNLDSKNGTLIMELLSSYCKKENKTLITATHSEQAAQYADRIIFMLDGAIQRIAPVSYRPQTKA